MFSHRLNPFLFTVIRITPIIILLSLVPIYNYVYYTYAIIYLCPTVWDTTSKVETLFCLQKVIWGRKMERNQRQNGNDGCKSMNFNVFGELWILFLVDRSTNSDPTSVRFLADIDFFCSNNFSLCPSVDPEWPKMYDFERKNQR